MALTIHSIYLPNLRVPDHIYKKLSGIASTRNVREQACQSTNDNKNPNNADKWNEEIDEWVKELADTEHSDKQRELPNNWNDDTIFENAETSGLTLKRLVMDELDNKLIIAGLKDELKLNERVITKAIEEIQVYLKSPSDNHQAIVPLSEESKTTLIRKSYAEIFNAKVLYCNQESKLDLNNEKILSLSEIIEKDDLDALKLYSSESPIQDESQFLDLYAQLHDAAMSNDKEPINFTFYGEEQLIKNLHRAFEKNQNLIPKNITLSFSPHMRNYSGTDLSQINGTGSINYNYRETIKQAYKPQSYTNGNINSLLQSKFLENFQENVIKTARSKEETKEVKSIYANLCSIAVNRYIQERIVQEGPVESNIPGDWNKLITDAVYSDQEIIKPQEKTLFSNKMTLKKLIAREEDNKNDLEELEKHKLPEDMITRITTEFIDALRKEYSSKEIAQIDKRSTVHSYLYTTFERSATVDELSSFVHNRVKEPELSDFVDDSDSEDFDEDNDVVQTPIGMPAPSAPASTHNEPMSAESVSIPNDQLSASETVNDVTQSPPVSISDKSRQLGLGVNLYRNGMEALIKELEKKHGGFINRALSRVLYIHEIAVIRELKKMLPDYTGGGLSAAAEQQKLNKFVDSHIKSSPHKKMKEIFTKYKELYQVTTEKTSEENVDLDENKIAPKKS